MYSIVEGEIYLHPKLNILTSVGESLWA